MNKKINLSLKTFSITMLVIGIVFIVCSMIMLYFFKPQYLGTWESTKTTPFAGLYLTEYFSFIAENFFFILFFKFLLYGGIVTIINSLLSLIAVKINTIRAYKTVSLIIGLSYACVLLFFILFYVMGTTDTAADFLIIAVFINVSVMKFIFRLKDEQMKLQNHQEQNIS